MGTGVGEAMLIGAVTGAGTSAITGGDPLKGALFGAAGGGFTSGLGGALGGAPTAAAAEGAALSSATAANTAATAAQQGILEAGGSQVAADNAFRQTFMDKVVPVDAIKTAPQTGFMDIFKPGIPTGDSTQRDFGQRLGDFLVQNPGQAAMLGGGAASMLAGGSGMPEPPGYEGPLSRFRYDPRFYRPAYASGGPIGNTDQGIAGTERGMYPQSQFAKTQYAVPSQMPTSAEVIESDYEPRVNPYTGQEMAKGGIADLGGYSDGGRLLKGPGDGMSDSIPARIGSRQPARLADGEFVVPADVVSHLGNGSTDAGAKQLYAMMDRVRRDRTGTKKQGKQIKPKKYVPV
jgi:hypothetical protein